jgi:hypothetical protein
MEVPMKYTPVLGLLAACLGLAAPRVAAQSFNIDWNVNNPAGVWSGAPGASFDGAADQSGTWNTITSFAGVQNLTSVTGAATPVDFYQSHGNTLTL